MIIYTATKAKFLKDALERDIEDVERLQGTVRDGWVAWIDVQGFGDEAVAGGVQLDAAELSDVSGFEGQLRREDFVAFRANWQPKSDNLREIAASLVPAECLEEPSPAESRRLARLGLRAAPPRPAQSLSYPFDVHRLRQSVGASAGDRPFH